MAAKNKREARIAARNAVNAWSIGLSTLAVIPGSGYVMTAGDVAMVVQIAKIYGVDIETAGAATLLTTFAAPLVGRTVAYGILDFIPFAGWIAKGVVSFGVSKVLGETIIAHFEDCSLLPDF
jgi:uncharacterized protein (DUF697 family)